MSTPYAGIGDPSDDRVVVRRDRLWCLAVVAALDIDQMAGVLREFNRLRDNPDEIPPHLRELVDTT